jgi:type II secretory pathway component PulF
MTFLIDKIQIFLARSSLRQRRGDFYQDLAAALEDRVSIFTVLKGFEARARRRDPSTAKMYLEMMKAMQKEGLAHALRPIISSTELIMLDAIQNSGDATLAKGLFFMSDMCAKLDRMSRVMRKAVTYPILLLIVFSALLVGFSIYAVPVIESLLPVEKWPPIGQKMHAVATIVRNYGLFIAVTVLVMLVAFMRSLSRWQGPVRRALDSYPPYNVYRSYTGAMLIVSLSSLMRTGVSLRGSIERAMKFSSPWLRWHLRETLRALSSGNATQFGAAFRTGLLNPDMEDRVQEASERRDPVAAFVKIGVGSIDRIARSVEDAASKLNNALIVLGGLGLGSMIVAFFATMQSISSGIGPK